MAALSSTLAYVVIAATLAPGTGINPPSIDSRCRMHGVISPSQVALVDEINLVRTNPKHYAQIVQRHFADLGADKKYTSDGYLVQMKEGQSAVWEAVNYLASADAVAPLTLTSCLSLAAQEHVNEQGPDGLRGHIGKDGGKPSDRADRYLVGKAYCGENIYYGNGSIRSAVIGLLVDDGIASRGHRTNIFYREYKTIGVGFGSHAQFQSMMVNLMCIQQIDE